MKFAFKSLNTLVLAGLLATAGAGAALAQTPAAPPPAMCDASGHQKGQCGMGMGMGMDKMGRHDPAQMQAWVAKHQAELKAKLKITAAQEAAWSTYTAAMQPPTSMGQSAMPGQRAEMDKLTTPERIDKMQALQTERMAERSAMMKKHGDATKALYAALSPTQQKIFDAEHTNHEHHGEHKGQGPMQPMH